MVMGTSTVRQEARGYAWSGTCGSCLLEKLQATSIVVGVGVGNEDGNCVIWQRTASPKPIGFGSVRSSPPVFFVC